MVDYWLSFRNHLAWAAQAYRRGTSRIDFAPILIGAALLTFGMLRI